MAKSKSEKTVSFTCFFVFLKPQSICCKNKEQYSRMATLQSGFLQAGRIRRAECYFSLHDLLRSMTELINKTSQTKTMQKFRPRNDLDLLKQLCSSKVLVCSVLLNTLCSLCIKVFINYLVIPKERFFLRFASVTNKCFS